ncbi:carboxypeptidase-like regulatory domain-containing protein [Candidatus Caldatribacterium sp.]|uniref:carboxypeptidase-like regulatory domain-containing protein n=1 Tax=Candidatus Caldatribacterium sp. TaxID=2282143 RepID=UPI00299184A6|nr:carboxypeptidase-like regulatory domain-containing protein [Candidatus Caldatribacterium sp.]MDW8081862.1 carboxypeptidase-like regulatory domain-containing protein [Candidatus Calescibacterium sp.]
MTFLHGMVMLPADAPFHDGFWEYSSEGEEVPTVPIAGAKVVVLLAEGGTPVTQATTNDNGEFVARVPSGERYFLEVYVEGNLVALGFAEVGEERYHEVGTIGEESTLVAILKKRALVVSGRLEHSPDAATLQSWKENLLRLWRKGKTLLQFPPWREIAKKDAPVSLDPLRLFEKVTYFFGEDGHYLVILWEAKEDIEATLYIRPFRLPVFQKDGPVAGKEGRFVLPVEEFEGYLFFLEGKSATNLLGRTPTYVARAPFAPQIRDVVLYGYQEGPTTILRRETRGRKVIHFHADRDGVIVLVLRRAQERGFSIEMEFDLGRRRIFPRCFAQEGFRHLTLAMYFAEDRSFFWGPVGRGVKIREEEWEELLGLWKRVPPEVSLKDHFVEVGFGFPFVEVVGFFRDEEFRLFANRYPEDGVLLLSSRRLDSLDVESTIYYRGRVRLWGEGVFEGCFLDIDFEGRFTEDTEREGSEAAFPSFQVPVKGPVTLWVKAWVGQVRGVSLDTHKGQE